MSSSKSTRMLDPPSTASSSRGGHPRNTQDYYYQNYPNYPNFFTHSNLETSKYDQNFMLRYGSLTHPNSGQNHPKNGQNHPKNTDSYLGGGSQNYPRLYPDYPRGDENYTRNYENSTRCHENSTRSHENYTRSKSKSPRSEFFSEPRFYDSPVGAPPSPGVHRGAGGEWYIPRANLWCFHKGYAAEMCTECKATGGGGGGGGGLWKSSHPTGITPTPLPDTTEKGGANIEVASICSSINPPPTFTALDNYRPIRARQRCRHCSCGIIFAITTIFSLLVLILIAGFIIYVETVLKHQTANTMDRM